MKKKYFGFTLAEVLITLGIIGIVAGMTIPTLMQNMQNEQLKTQMRKEYSVLSEAYQLLKTENGTFEDAIGGCTGNSQAIDNCFKDVFKQKLKYAKECSGGATLGDCFPAESNVKNLNKNNASDAYLGNGYTSGLVLNDGTSLALYLNNTLCKGTAGPNYPNTECGFITIDVNGVKPPNTWGRDIYLFFIYTDAIRPSAVGVVESWAANSDDCNTGTNNGYTCASKYLLGN